MRFLNRYFFLGLGVGVVLTVGAIIGVGAIIVFKYMPSAEDLEAMLPPPELPDHEQLPIYGQAEYDWTLRSLDGTQTTLADFKGKVVFLNLWATWCLPCVAEMPSIQTLYKAVKADDVAFLFLTNEDATTVELFLRDRQLDLPIYIYDELPDVFRPPGVPTTYIINRDGLIIYKQFGAADWVGEAPQAFIRSLM